ncbi:HAD-IIB family hydrolase [Lactobacillus sp. S2-2]|uniref:HAD-IIB family hydrolase n=1 Tax=Lactobacillus sp. S2-2 TaxID=2692917 RepID=UPI001F3742A8|nr:HAD family hydrolase [Lactobacillus sp. S2-2]MCF6515724.1 HAD-IIB family hydrolase [Lactobacillus sp. S2-2]
MIKMIATDMNKTFLDSNNSFDKSRFNSLMEKIKQQNIKFVVASGGGFSKLSELFGENSKYLDFVTQNGAVIYQNNQILNVDDIKQSDLEKTLQLIKNNFSNDIRGIIISGIKNNYVDQSIDDKSFNLLTSYYNNIVKVNNIYDINQVKIDDKIIKIGVTFNQSINNNVKIQAMREMLPEKLSSLNSGFNTELIGNEKNDKKYGIECLLDFYNINSDELVVFGDNENDLGMLEMTKNSYAMKNGIDEVKKVSNYVTKYDNNESGVLETIEDILG